jgi:glycosyltransferase involved in cell wall biosynthesis
VCLASGGPIADELRRAGVDVQVLGVPRIYGTAALRALGRLGRLLRDERVGIVHTYLVSSNLFGAAAARLAGIRKLVTTRRDLGFSRNARLAFLEETFVNPRVSRVVTPSEAVSDSARRERGLDSRRVVTIPNGIDVDSFRPLPGLRETTRSELGIREGAAVVGVIANFLAVKGHEDFLRAAVAVRRRLPEAVFVLVGDGPLRARTESLARELGIAESVLFTGARGDARALLSAFDLLVSPSLSEGMSNVLLEAMSMETPIVATSVGGTSELLRHGVTGLLAPPRHPGALSEAMLALLSDRARGAALGRDARRDASERFRLDRMIHRYGDLYEEILREVEV